MTLTYSKMKEYFYDWSSGNAKEAIIRRLLSRADTLVEEKDIQLFYPKNLFLENKNFELYLFCFENRIIKINVEDEKFIVTKCYDKDNIEKVFIRENSENEYEKGLQINFKDNDVFQFNSINDTNEYYKEDLASIIHQIFINIALPKIK